MALTIRDNIINGKTYREFYFDNNELIFVVEAYEYEEDEMRETEPDYEFDGEYFYRGFDNFKEAIEKYIELLEQRWEVVRFYIRFKHRKTLDSGIYFIMNVEKDTVDLTIQVNTSKIVENYSKKLTRIKEIIEEVDSDDQAISNSR